MPQTVVVLGARNLGGAVNGHFLALGWNAAGVARREGALERVPTAGALALQADASDPQTLASALERARRKLACRSHGRAGSAMVDETCLHCCTGISPAITRALLCAASRALAAREPAAM